MAGCDIAGCDLMGERLAASLAGVSQLDRVGSGCGGIDPHDLRDIWRPHEPAVTLAGHRRRYRGPTPAQVTNPFRGVATAHLMFGGAMGSTVVFSANLCVLTAVILFLNRNGKRVLETLRRLLNGCKLLIGHVVLLSACRPGC